MDRRVFIQAAGILGVAVLTGCGGGGAGYTGRYGTASQSQSQVATLTVHFNATDTGRSVLPDGTLSLLLRGYDGDGNVVYGPNQVPVPPNDTLVVQVPATMTTFEIAGLALASPT